MFLTMSSHVIVEYGLDCGIDYYAAKRRLGQDVA